MSQITTIIAYAEHVIGVLGKGHHECVYGKALAMCFTKNKEAMRCEVCCPIYFMDEIIGYGKADFVVGKYIIEIKANKRKPENASDQLEKYIKSLTIAEKTKYNGLILNFNQESGKIDYFIQKPQNFHAKPKVVSKFFVPKEKKK